MAAKRRLALLGVVALARLFFDVGAAPIAAAEPRHADVGSDFNADGYSDLAVSVMDDSGNFVTAVVILHGSPTGLRRTGDQFPGTKAPSAALATGDFDGDRYSDLAIGDPDADPGGVRSAGAVRVIYGSAAGLDPRRITVWHQGSSGIPGKAERDDWFGATLAVGNFGRGDADDLAIGSSGESGLRRDAGSVTVLYGSNRGLTAAGSRGWTSSTRGVPGIGNHYEGFGSALVAGQFSSSGYHDLAIGAPDQTENEFSAGAVVVLRGSKAGLSTRGSQRWTQDSPGIVGRSQKSDSFGSTMAVGRFGRSGPEDLAIGVLFEDIQDVEDAGALHVVYGSPDGLTASGNQMLSQKSRGIAGVLEERDLFGLELAAGNVGGSHAGQDELLVGVSNESLRNVAFAGQIHLLRGSRKGITTRASQVLTSKSVGLGPEEADGFGDRLVTGQFADPHSSQRRADLAVLLASDDAQPRHEGDLFVLRGSPSDLGPKGAQRWTSAAVGAGARLLFDSMTAAAKGH